MYLTVIDNLNGIIDDNDIFILSKNEILKNKITDSSGPEYLKVPQKLFWNGRNYDLSFDFISSGKGGKLVAWFIQSRPPLVKLKVSGRFIKRLIFTKGYLGLFTAVFDSPGPYILIPQGMYNKQRVYLIRFR